MAASVKSLSSKFDGQKSSRLGFRTNLGYDNQSTRLLFNVSHHTRLCVVRSLQLQKYMLSSPQRKFRSSTVGSKPAKNVKRCEIFQKGKKNLKKKVERESPLWGRNNFNHRVPQFGSSDKISESKRVSTLEYDAIQMPKDVQERTSIYIMLPLDQVSIDGVLQKVKALEYAFLTLKRIGCDGVMVDCWWGIVERSGPKVYDWKAYRQLIDLVRKAGLTMQAVMSFHACGPNVGDGDVKIPLPSWVLKAGLSDPDIFFTDKQGRRNWECISLFCDEEPVLAGRTPIQCYRDFCESFREMCGSDLGSTVTEVAIGMGPCGELRYTSYPSSLWEFPGLGEFQCYDKRALASLAKVAEEACHPEWGKGGPHDAGHYNNRPWDTGFFRDNGSYQLPYGRFFLDWYSRELLSHGDRMLTMANSIFSCCPEGERALITLKCAGVHWWYKTASHAAELTSGYYNTNGRDAYAEIAKLCKRHGALLNFTCTEMRDCEQPEEAFASPEGLLKQVRQSAARLEVTFCGENALYRVDKYAYDQIINTAAEDSNSTTSAIPRMMNFTFLRFKPELLRKGNLYRFQQFVNNLKGIEAPESSLESIENEYQSCLMESS